jgi:hypothetical protein
MSFAVLGAMLAFEANAQQQRRIPGHKMTLDQLRTMPKTDQVVVKFLEGQKLSLSGQGLTGLRSGQANSLERVFAAFGVSGTAIKPLHDVPPEELEREKNDAQQRSGRQLADLSVIVIPVSVGWVTPLSGCFERHKHRQPKSNSAHKNGR